MTCTHEEREYFDCDCQPWASGARCSKCDYNSKCVACDELLEARPNVGLADDEPDESVKQIGKPLAKKLAKRGVMADPDAPITSLERCSWCADTGVAGDIECDCGASHKLSAAELQRRIAVASDYLLMTGRMPGPGEINFEALDTVCSECNEPQYWTPGGACCINGHGGAEGVKPEPAKKPKKKRATIGKRSNEEKAHSDSTCTPKWLADLLFETHGWFDIDPASNARSWIQALWSYSIEKCLDGLRLPWRGSAFLNHPFSLPLPWMLKAHAEMTLGRCTELVNLAKFDPSTEWWEVATSPVTITRQVRSTRLIMHYYPDIWMFKDRIQYDEDPVIVQKRVDEFAAAQALYERGEGDKPRGRKDGKSSNNFCSVIIHHRFDLPPLQLEYVATRWVRA